MCHPWHIHDTQREGAIGTGPAPVSYEPQYTTGTCSTNGSSPTGQERRFAGWRRGISVEELDKRGWGRGSDWSGKEVRLAESCSAILSYQSLSSLHWQNSSWRLEKPHWGTRVFPQKKGTKVFFPQGDLWWPGGAARCSSIQQYWGLWCWGTTILGLQYWGTRAVSNIELGFPSQLRRSGACSKHLSSLISKALVPIPPQHWLQIHIAYAWTQRMASSWTSLYTTKPLVLFFDFGVFFVGGGSENCSREGRWEGEGMCNSMTYS